VKKKGRDSETFKKPVVGQGENLVVCFIIEGGSCRGGEKDREEKKKRREERRRPDLPGEEVGRKLIEERIQNAGTYGPEGGGGNDANREFCIDSVLELGRSKRARFD